MMPAELEVVPVVAVVSPTSEFQRRHRLVCLGATEKYGGLGRVAGSGSVLVAGLTAGAAQVRLFP